MLAQWGIGGTAPKMVGVEFWAGAFQTNRPITMRSLLLQSVAGALLPDVYTESRSREKLYEHTSAQGATPAASPWSPIDAIWFHLADLTSKK